MKKVQKRYLFIIIILIIILLIPIIAKTIIKKAYPFKYDEIITKYSNEYNVDKLLVLSVIKAESNFKEDVVSSQNAVGIMQILEETAKEIAEKENIEYQEGKTLLNPEENIKLGTKYLSELIQTYNGNYILAITAYNAGIGNVNKWIDTGIIKEDGSNIENIPFKETNNYVRKIIRNYKIYSSIIGK